MYTDRRELLSPEFIYNAAIDCFKHKRGRKDVHKLIASYSNGKFTYKQIRDMILSEGFNEEVSACIAIMAQCFYDEIIDRRITFAPIHNKTIIDGPRKKSRIISIESMKQQVFDYIAVGLLSDIFRRSFGSYQCASIKGKGQICAKEAIEDWVQNDKSNTKWFIKTDIVDYFHSVNHDILQNMIFSHITSENARYLISTILSTYSKGLSIGSYLSQYLANYFVSDIYHIMTEEMIRVDKHGNRYNRVTHMAIYMDDILIFCKRKKDAYYAYEKLESLIKEKHLELHKTRIEKFRDNMFLDVIGYRFYRDHTTIRRVVYNRIRKLTVKSKRYKIMHHIAYQLISYNGCFEHSDSFKAVKRFDFNQILKYATDLVSGGIVIFPSFS